MHSLGVGKETESKGEGRRQRQREDPDDGGLGGVFVRYQSCLLCSIRAPTVLSDTCLCEAVE